METLPNDMLKEILTNLSDQDLFQACRLNKTFVELCRDENFWEMRGKLKYPKEINELKDTNPTWTWKKSYQWSPILYLKHTFPEVLKNKSLSKIYHLRELYLGDNQLTSIPKELGRLSALQTLYLYNNQLTSIPKELGNLEQLRVLDLYGNQLTSIPKELGRLSALRRLYLSNNRLTFLPKELGSLSALKYLDLRENPLKSIPDNIINIPRIEIYR